MTAPSTANSTRETRLPEVFTVQAIVPETVVPLAGDWVRMPSVEREVVARRAKVRMWTAEWVLPGAAAAAGEAASMAPPGAKSRAISVASANAAASGARRRGEEGMHGGSTPVRATSVAYGLRWTFVSVGWAPASER